MKSTLAKLNDLMGFVQNSTELTVKLFQDDATMCYHMEALKYNGTVSWNEWGNNLEELINKAWEKHGEDYLK